MKRSQVLLLSLSLLKGHDGKLRMEIPATVFIKCWGGGGVRPSTKGFLFFSYSGPVGTTILPLSDEVAHVYPAGSVEAGLNQDR